MAKWEWTREELAEDRTTAIKSLRKDEGMTLDKVKELDPKLLCAITMIESPTPDYAFDLIRWSALAMPDDQYSRAIRNALAIGMGVGAVNLTERRMRLLEVMDVSLRTLITYEDTGALALAREIDKTRAARNKSYDMTVDDVAIQIMRVREVLDRSGADADLPLRLSRIETRLEAIERRLKLLDGQEPSDILFRGQG